MRDYELTVLVRATLGEKELGKEIKSLQTLLEKANAKIKSKKDPRKQTMQYEIGKSREAYYVYWELSLETDRVAEVESKLKLGDNS